MARCQLSPRSLSIQLGLTIGQIGDLSELFRETTRARFFESSDQDSDSGCESLNGRLNDEIDLIMAYISAEQQRSDTSRVSFKLILKKIFNKLKISVDWKKKI